jgi:hypothetical protein
VEIQNARNTEMLWGQKGLSSLVAGIKGKVINMKMNLTEMWVLTTLGLNTDGIS